MVGVILLVVHAHQLGVVVQAAPLPGISQEDILDVAVVFSALLHVLLSGQWSLSCWENRGRHCLHRGREERSSSCLKLSLDRSLVRWNPLILGTAAKRPALGVALGGPCLHVSSAGYPRPVGNECLLVGGSSLPDCGSWSNLPAILNCLR